MRILVTIENSPAQRLLVRLPTKEAIREVKELLRCNKRERAIMTVIARGEFERKVAEEDVRNTQADLILTKYGAHWNLL